MSPAELANTAAPTIEERLEQAEAEVRGYCGWHIAPEKQMTVHVEGNGSHTLLLPSLHVDVIHAVTDEGGNPVTGWKLRATTAALVGITWRAGVEYSIELTHGHKDPPPDIVGVVQALAKGDVALGLLKSKTSGPFAESYAVDARAQAILDTLDRHSITWGP